MTIWTQRALRHVDDIAAYLAREAGDEVADRILRRIEDIPTFANEAEEHAFWATHELSDELWDEAEPFAAGELPPPRSTTVLVAIRFDTHTLERIKALARRRHKGYQTLLKEFVAERLYEEEKRDGPLS